MCFAFFFNSHEKMVGEIVAMVIETCSLEIITALDRAVEQGAPQNLHNKEWKENFVRTLQLHLNLTV